MSTISNDLSIIIDEYIKNYCEIDDSDLKGWFVSTKILCRHFKITTQKRISISALGGYVDANYEGIVKCQKRIPFMGGRQTVLTNLIISEKKEQFEKYFENKNKEKLNQKSNEKIIKINHNLHNVLMKLKFDDYKTIPEKMEIILNHYTKDTPPTF